MAKIYPDRPLPGTKSHAERTVFFALKELLPSDYIVLHSVQIYRRETPVGRLNDGEADFVIIHPDKGLLLIEVKGGKIRRDQESGEWFSIGFKDKDKMGNKIKDPYEQAKSNVHDLAKDLSKERSTRRHRFSFGHAVWFPNVDVAKADLRLSTAIQGITLGKEDVENAASAIPRLYKNSLGEKPPPFGPTKEGSKAIVDFLCPSLELNFALSSIQGEQEKQIHQATLSQYRVLTHLKRHNKALICGSAGSGKTFLAMEKAKRIIDEDKSAKVLLICFNKNLASMIKEKLQPLGESVDVFHFHGLCSELFKRAEIPFPVKDPHSSDKAFFEEVLPSALLDVLDVLDSRYDSIIVDEAQDFNASWWLPLQCLLDDLKDGLLYIFYDDNQSIYREGAKNFPIEDAPITLGENCRNTKQISNYVNTYYGGEPPEAIGPEGPEPIIVDIEDEGLETTLQQVLGDLTKKHGYTPKDIIVLTPHSKENSALGLVNRLGKHTIDWFDGCSQNSATSIHCCTIHSFKGLEKPVVVVAEIHNIPEYLRKELLYVACSRAKSHLVLLQPSLQ